MTGIGILRAGTAPFGYSEERRCRMAWIVAILVLALAVVFLVLALVANPVDVPLPTSAKALIIISAVIVVIAFVAFIALIWFFGG